MDENNRNFILAILLSIGVLFAWQTFFLPAPEQAPGPKPAEQQQQEQQVELGPPQPQGQETKPSGDMPRPGGTSATLTREQALAKSPRIGIDTPSLTGSIALTGGRIDDLTLKDYRVTADGACPACATPVPGRWSASFEGQQTPFPFLPRLRSQVVQLDVRR